MTHVPSVRLNNGVEIPQLGFGVFMVPPEDAEQVVSTALEVGYRHIDTATAYGNEEGVGKAVRASGLAREEVFITTKLWNEGQGFDSALKELDASLERLGMDYVDLYLIHWPAPARDLYVESWRALEKAYAEGRARSIGVSNFQPTHLRRLADETTVVPALNQVELHPTFVQAELRRVHDEMGIKTESWSPLGQAQDLENPAVTALAEEVGRTPAQVILRWHLQLGIITIPKSANPKRIRENFELFDFELSEEQMGQITGLDSGNRIGGHPDELN